MDASIRERIDTAAAPAAAHADAVSPGWQERALERVVSYAREHASFIAEQVRLLAEAEGFDRPPSRRAWGAVMVTACKRGYIKKIGYAMSTSPGANPTPVTEWGSNLVVPSSGEKQCWSTSKQ